ncbi:MAG: hypothetical protein LKE54_02940 [Prevotella sp.]|nr:hypothetical protein [Prevotella sp.]MCH3994004.1 hypothetical protein [Prevotella sp.]
MGFLEIKVGWLRKLRFSPSADENKSADPIYGLWFIPHEADICIVLHKNHTFEDYTYRINKDSSITDVVIKGSFYMKGDSLMMKGENGGVKKLRHWKSGDDDNYYLTKGKGTGVGNWYVKEDDPY